MSARICRTCLPGSSSHGFTAIELVVVIAVMVVFIAVVVKTSFNPQSQRNRLAAVDLENGLRYAQRLALSREQTVRVTFSTASNAYWVDLADTNAAGGYIPAKDPVTQTDWLEIITNSYAGVRLASVNVGGGSVLYFSMTNGIPCGTSGGPIVSTGTVVFASGQTVYITPDTGYISLSP